MMATLPSQPTRSAAPATRLSTRASSPRPRAASRSSRLPACASRPSADLAGRAVAIAREVPAEFGAPLGAHHKLLGRWVAARAPQEHAFTRVEARRHIEAVFDKAVMELLQPIALTNLRVLVMRGDDELPPALAVICDDIGQLDLGWIGKANVLSDTLNGPVAPAGWRAAAYKALEGTLPSVVTVFNYADLFEEFSAYHWEGATTDEDAREYLSSLYGDDPEVEDMLPSAMNAKRPDFMTAKPDPLKQMPKALQARLRRLTAAFDAHRAAREAWMIGDFERATHYLPELEEASHLPSLTLVPHDQFARELDEVGRHGMEMGFMDVAGLCELPSAELLDGWFESFRLGLDVLRAAQDLIDFDPSKPESRA